MNFEQLGALIWCFLENVAFIYQMGSEEVTRAMHVPCLARADLAPR